ncbi:LysR family transcriptional regulator [Streptomyces sp. HU2014]|uniref:LysR family transcriptional regulator n=1 Tax=Streptomyces albireticuli TaxID=1940 RepID=A0A1Z2KYY8_9ACTN|nr:MULTISPECIES: LysR family transcriptional regulator [Streptomyces]ARZ67161.1 LysR family transcriptional regulator [Streptomyces albireticuli]UQI47228.1 LysR family transcriptional regulator [Streptomyces sp. HU2014]
MSLRQMEYLVAVVEEESFTRAAETLNVTQSALSHQIKALEREVGGPLLERRPRGIGLTPMGRAYLPHAELAVRSAEQARRAAKAAAGAAGGELHIASLHALAVGVMPPLFARWRAAHPAVRLHLHEYATTEELRDHMERGVADLAIGPRPDDWPGPVVPLGTERIALITHAGDPLAARPGPVSVASLADRAWVRCALEPVIQGRRWLDWVCAQGGFAPRTAVWTEHSSTAVRMAVAGLGLVAAPVHMARDVPGAVVLPTDPPWRREQTAFSRVELTGTTAAFAGLCQELAFPEPEPEPEPAGQPRTSSATG